ncbi:hypothetical protein [Adlercreutzia mucosicola]|uniref:hypothetical protein n=1 Tax=Adlercreutzia mucosicola TaxID=580026 RepID=UPI0004143ABA|nr:hypothetical protein [Adlercreutzia mucosicola]MCR2034121.1 hypothetical protein [Adlercreutzia mucosicola]
MGAGDLSIWQEQQLARLREPFPDDVVQLKPVYVGEYDVNDEGKRFVPPSAVQLCPRCGKMHALPAKHFRYIGHALVTERLNEVDPSWSMHPMAVRDSGEPITTGGLWIRLRVCGVEKIGFGDAGGKTGPDAIKEMIGDAIRNAAMRFGCGLAMWMDDDDEVTPHPGGDGRPPFSARLGARATKAQRRLAKAIGVIHESCVYDGNDVADGILVEFGKPYYKMNEREVDDAIAFLGESFPIDAPTCDDQTPLRAGEVDVIRL